MNGFAASSDLTQKQNSEVNKMGAANNVHIMGRLTADPELKQTASGISTCRFTVAVDRARSGQNGERQADFISVVAWRQTAEFVARYFSKGKMIAIEGELRTGSYADKRYPDVKHFITEVYASSVAFCGDKASSQSNENANYTNNGYMTGNNTANASNTQNSALAGDMSDFEEVISDSELPF